MSIDGKIRDAGRSIIGGGGAHIHIFVLCSINSFEIEIKTLKSIDFTVCEQEYMNMCLPPPPPPIIDLPACLGKIIKQVNSKKTLDVIIDKNLCCDKQIEISKKSQKALACYVELNHSVSIVDLHGCI